MKKVTAIRTGKGRGNRVRVFLDGEFGFSLEAEIAARENLRAGKELSVTQIEALARDDSRQRCLNATAHYLSYRPRSEAELRGRLHRRGFDDDSIESAIVKLKEQGLVDDTAFARFWRDNRQHFSPRSRWLTSRELRQKGIAEEVISEAVVAVDDEENAYRAATNKCRCLPLPDYDTFRRRLGGYLRRRGFSYGTIIHVVEAMWQERKQEVNGASNMSE